jgi:predicted Zn-dependent protease
MIENEQKRVWVNRVMAFLIGGVIVLAVMAFAVASPLRKENTTLTAQLDEIRNGAVRLLGEATVQFQNKSYDDAKKTLNVLFQEQPTSAEAAEGKKLFSEIDAIIRQMDEKWDAASEEVRAEWEKMRTAELRANLEKERVTVETNLADTLNKEWERAKSAVRRDWEQKAM